MALFPAYWPTQGAGVEVSAIAVRGSGPPKRSRIYWLCFPAPLSFLSMSEPSDSELLHRARQGDAIPFGTLVRRHDRYLYRLARSVLADDHEAEDVVQLTFIKAYTQLAQFRGEASLRTWLGRITLNEAVPTYAASSGPARCDRRGERARSESN